MTKAIRTPPQRTRRITIRRSGPGERLLRLLAAMPGQLSRLVIPAGSGQPGHRPGWLARTGLLAVPLSQPIFTVNSVPTSRRRDWVAAIAAVALTMLGIVAYGLDRADMSMAVDAFWGIAVLLACRVIGFRRTLLRFSSMKFVLGLFAALILWLFLSLTPWSPVGNLSQWSAVGSHAATLDRTATLLELSRLLGLAATFVVGLALGSSDRRTEMVLRALCVAGAIYALLALAFHVLDPTQTIRAAQTGFENRLTATFFSPNVAAGLFGVLAILMLSSISVSDPALTRMPGRDVSIVLQYGMLVSFLACLVLTASRMGTAGAVAGMAVATALHSAGVRGHAQRWRYLGPQMVGLGVFSALAVAGQLLIARFWTLSADGNGRRALYETHWQAFLQRPFTGYGLGSFTQLNRSLQTTATFGDLWNVRAAHSVFLQWLEEGGLIGAGLMFAVIGVILFEIYRGQSQRQTSRWAMRGILGASIALLVHGTADFALQTPAVATLWALLLGVGYAAATGGHRADALAQMSTDAAPPRVRWWGPVGLAVAVELLCLTVLWGGGRTAVDQRFPVTLRTAYLQRAHDLLAQPAARLPTDEIRHLARSALKQSPLDAYAWMMLAEIDRGRPEGLAAFRESYRAAPFDPNLFKWRTTYAANLWATLSERDRATVMQDIAAERHQFWDLRSWLTDLAAAHQGEAFALAMDVTARTDDQQWPEGSNP